MIDIITPLAPRAGNWRELPEPETWRSSYATRFFIEQNHGWRVISAVEVAERHLGPEYHLSISASSARGETKRISLQDAQQVLVQFGAAGALEDNHVPYGRVRNFWRPVAEPKVGLVCECQADEPAIREDRGDYVWRPVS